MASQSADIGANFSDYQGNPNLGERGLGVFDIDTKPLAQLASYTFFYNKNKWEQKQRETDAKVAQLADLSNIALNDLRGKDKEYMVKGFADLMNDASEYARKDPKTPQERMQNELDWQTRYGAFKNNYGSGKGRAVAYYAQRNWILANITDAKTQDEAIRQLDKRFDDTDITTPISAVPNFKIEKFDIPEPIGQEVNTIGNTGNELLDVKMQIYNPTQNGGLADAFILDVGHAYPSKGTPEYERLSPNEKDQAAIQGTIPSSGKGWIDSVGILNKAMEPYVKDGKFDAKDEESFETENASNTTLMKAYNAVKAYDSYNRNKYNQALNHEFDDNGIKIKLPGSVNPNDFKVGFVDFVKGVTANNLVQAGSLAKWKDKIDKKITNTGETNDLIKARLIQSGENYRAKLAHAAKDPKEIGVIDKPAILFRQHIDRAKKFFRENKGRDLIVPYNKVDDKTRVAAKLSEGDFIIYKSDGSYQVSSDSQGNAVKSIGTIENLAQGYIDAVKTIDLAEGSKDASMAEGFQIKSENKFKEIYGTASGKYIWDNWGETKSPDNTTVAPKSSAGGMSNEEYNNFLKKNGLK